MNKKEMQWFGIKKKSFYNTYGRSINVSTGLIFGLLIDKTLFYLTKGLSIFIPPFAALLLSKGTVLCSIKFEKEFNPIVEKLLSHVTQR